MGDASGDRAVALVAVRVGAMLAEEEPRLARLAFARAWLWAGEVERGAALVHEELGEAELAGDALVAAEGLALLAGVDAGRGELTRALSNWDEAATRLGALGRPGSAASALLDAADTLLDRDGAADVSAAASRLAAARTFVRDAGIAALEPRLRLLLARARGATGDPSGALADLRSLEPELRPHRWLACRAAAAIAAVHRLRGEDALARQHFERAAGMVEEIAAQLPREHRAAFLAEPRCSSVREQATLRADAPGRPGSALGSDPSRDGRWMRLLEITKRLASERDLPRLLERICDSAVELSGAERGFVLLLDDEGKLVPHVVRDAARPEDPHIAFSQSIAEAVLIDGEPIVTVDARSDGRLSEYLSVHRLMLQSVACVPIRTDRGHLGVLYVENRVRRGRFGESDVELLLLFADQAAIALANAQLLDKIQQKNEELERQTEELARARAEIERLLVATAEERDQARDELGRMKESLSARVRQGIVGRSEGMRRVLAVIERVQAVSIPVVIHGESGTGKELVARAIHHGGVRQKGPFVALNCAAIPETLLESELFGHEKGAFTGADRARHGVFVQADGGTLFLDEIGDMPSKMQVELLRVLADGKVRPIGSEHERQVDVRVVAASNKSLRDLVKRGLFREDLFYRLAVVELTLPPLRERAGDVPLLAEHLLSQIAERAGHPKKRLSPRALARLASAPMPGNVRQLEHVLVNACVMSDGDVIEAKHLPLDDGMTAESLVELPQEPDDVSGGAPGEQPDRAPAGAMGAALPANEEEWKTEERRRILAALEAASWNRLRAAESLGMPRRTFYRRLKEYGILAS